MSKELDKLIGKLKKKDVVEEIQKEEEVKEKEIEEEEEDLEEEEEEVKEEVKEDVKPKIQDQENMVTSEVGILQNEGIFRRELLIVLKELVDVQKIQTQTFLDLKKKLLAD